jgi:hypothetical protein
MSFSQSRRFSYIWRRYRRRRDCLIDLDDFIVPTAGLVDELVDVQVRSLGVGSIFSVLSNFVA